MTEPHYERLSVLDASFLSVEAEDTHMHVASVSTFDARPLTRADGGLDVERIEQAMQQMLARNPRMRQKVWWPLGGAPVWIDDSDFRLSYHVRHTALPLPGTMRQLKRLAGRVMSHTLDTRKPLWEIWLIEGLENERFAIMAKLHHCLADGISARDILTGYLGTEPTAVTEPTPPSEPRPAPSLARMALDDAMRRNQQARQVVGGAASLLRKSDSGLRASLADAASGLVNAATSLVGSASPTPFNRKIGPHRRFDCTRFSFADVLALRNTSGGKVNDVVLAVVAAAVRRFLIGRRLSVDRMDFRVMVPVNVRQEGRETTGGNFVSSMTVPLPLFETDPRRRLQRIIETTTRAKASKQSRGGELLTRAADWTGFFVPRLLASRGARRLTANLVVTNVPGPLFPMYLLESRLLESFPLVPLAPEQALGIALYTYDKSLHWGFNADLDAFPDLHDFVQAVDVEWRELVDAWTPIELRATPPLVQVAPEVAGASDSPRESVRPTAEPDGDTPAEGAPSGATASGVTPSAATPPDAAQPGGGDKRPQRGRSPKRARRKPDASANP
jgi:WS/DGAT/MGAT family acyltransferase